MSCRTVPASNRSEASQSVCSRGGSYAHRRAVEYEATMGDEDNTTTTPSASGTDQLQVVFDENIAALRRAALTTSGIKDESAERAVSASAGTICFAPRTSRSDAGGEYPTVDNSEPSKHPSVITGFSGLDPKYLGIDFTKAEYLQAMAEQGLNAEEAEQAWNAFRLAHVNVVGVSMRSQSADTTQPHLAYAGDVPVVAHRAIEAGAPLVYYIPTAAETKAVSDQIAANGNPNNEFEANREQIAVKEETSATILDAMAKEVVDGVRHAKHMRKLASREGSIDILAPGVTLNKGLLEIVAAGITILMEELGMCLVPAGTGTLEEKLKGTVGPARGIQANGNNLAESDRDGRYRGLSSLFMFTGGPNPKIIEVGDDARNFQEIGSPEAQSIIISQILGTCAIPGSTRVGVALRKHFARNLADKASVIALRGVLLRKLTGQLVSGTNAKPLLSDMIGTIQSADGTETNAALFETNDAVAYNRNTDSGAAAAAMASGVGDVLTGAAMVASRRNQLNRARAVNTMAIGDIGVVHIA